MRTLFRSMKADGDRPKVEESARGLGVRAAGPNADVHPDANGVIGPGGGMSVAPDDPMLLEVHRRPKEFGGTGRDPVWKMADTALPGDAEFVLTGPAHGQVEPAVEMSLADFSMILAGTQQSWNFAEVRHE